jgi:hypothetical protein
MTDISEGLLLVLLQQVELEGLGENKFIRYFGIAGHIRL